MLNGWNFEDLESTFQEPETLMWKRRMKEWAEHLKYLEQLAQAC